MAAYIKSADHLTVVFDNGESATVYTSHARYKDIVAALAAKDYELVKTLTSPALAVKAKIDKIVKRNGTTVELIGGIVYYNGEALHNTLTQRIIEMSNEGFDIQPMTKFLANLQQNPSFRAVNELYTFLEKGTLPITEDGHFLAYKSVRDNYLDHHSGTVPNKLAAMFTNDEFNSMPLTIGNVTVDVVDGITVITMPRNKVNEDPTQTCEAGLHFCSRDYLGQMGSGRTLILKINPADVVAIPTDHNDAKGRTCRYEIIGELGATEKLEGAFRPSPGYVEPVDEDETEDDLDDSDYYDYDGLDIEEDSIEVKLVEDEDGNIVLTLAGDPTTITTIPVQVEKLLMVDPETGTAIDEYDSIKEAAEDNGVTVSMINRVLKGDRKTTGGYEWRWGFIDVPVDPTAPHPDNLAALHEHGTLKGGNPHSPGPYDNFIAVATDDGDRWPYDSEEDEDDDRPW